MANCLKNRRISSDINMSPKVGLKVLYNLPVQICEAIVLSKKKSSDGRHEIGNILIVQ